MVPLGSCNFQSNILKSTVSSELFFRVTGAQRVSPKVASPAARASAVMAMPPSVSSSPACPTVSLSFAPGKAGSDFVGVSCALEPLDAGLVASLLSLVGSGEFPPPDSADAIAITAKRATIPRSQKRFFLYHGRVAFRYALSALACAFASLGEEN